MLVVDHQGCQGHRGNRYRASREVFFGKIDETGWSAEISRAVPCKGVGGIELLAQEAVRGFIDEDTFLDCIILDETVLGRRPEEVSMGGRETYYRIGGQTIRGHHMGKRAGSPVEGTQASIACPEPQGAVGMFIEGIHRIAAYTGSIFPVVEVPCKKSRFRIEPVEPLVGSDPDFSGTVRLGEINEIVAYRTGVVLVIYIPHDGSGFGEIPDDAVGIGSDPQRSVLSLAEGGDILLRIPETDRLKPFDRRKSILLFIVNQQAFFGTDIYIISRVLQEAIHDIGRERARFGTGITGGGGFCGGQKVRRDSVGRFPSPDCSG